MYVLAKEVNSAEANCRPLLPGHQALYRANIAFSAFVTSPVLALLIFSFYVDTVIIAHNKKSVSLEVAPWTGYSHVAEEALYLARYSVPYIHQIWKCISLTLLT